MKKFILLMLTITLAALPVLSCAGDGGGQPHSPAETGEPGTEPGTTAEPGAGVMEVEEELTFPDLPNINFEGYDFRIMNTRAGAQGFILTQLIAEEETGEALNDAIFRRNRRMEDRFGFNVVEIGFNNPGQVRDAARRSIQAASDDFDLAMMQSIQALPLAQDGLFEMVDRIPHIDLTRPWWDQNMKRDLSIGNRLFFTSGDFSFNQYSVTIAILFNKELHEDLGLDCPYQLVREGRWTVDRFAEQGRAALRDLNGDGVFDQHDQFGLLAQSNVSTLALMNGMGARYVVKDADDLPVLNINTEGFISRFLTMFDLLTEEWHLERNRPPGSLANDQTMFFNNQALFWMELINGASSFRAMETDFGIIPVPKLDEQQAYHISATGHFHVMCIPVTTVDLARTGIILEALNAESRLTTLTVYYDTMLINQLMNRDEESGEMLDIIFANRVYETGRVFWDSNIANPIAHAMRDMNRDIVSVIERHEAAAVVDIGRTIAAFLEN